jgi:hypothetical protein
MKTKVKLSDVVAVVVGLIGAVLLWLHIDPKGIVLYSGFLIFGSSRVVEFFILKRFERNNLKEILKLITCVLMVVISGSHLLAGGRPLFGMLSLIVLLVAFSQLEPQKNFSEPETE